MVILFVFSLIVLVSISSYYTIRYVETKALKKANSRMSFKESLDLVGIPIITFCQGENKYHFILDTGAALSVVNEGAIKNFSYESLPKKGSNYGIDGNILNTSFIKAHIEYKDNKFEEEFQVLDLTSAFNNIKQDHGVTVTGILGNSFFTKYRYILDFKELVAYY